MNYLVTTVKNWNLDTYESHTSQLAGNWSIIDKRDDLTIENIEKINPRYIFFLHWSWIVPKEITDNYECVCFHMTDLPYGRGGSPLQNLIVRGHKDTILTALKMESGLDAGPVYYKRKLSLEGTAQEIFKRVTDLSWKMVIDFLNNNPSPEPQVGNVVQFKRRTPDQSLIPDELSVEELYDYIRMLDAPDYPKAFIHSNGWHLEFENAEFIGKKLIAKVTFIKK